MTSTRRKLPEEMEQAIVQIRKYSRKPIGVGFGVSTPEQAKEVSRIADGVIVGSAIVKLIEENLKHPYLVQKVGGFVASLAGALAETCPVG